MRKQNSGKIIGVLKLQIQSARGISRKKLDQDLTKVCIAANMAKNAMARHWQRWKEDNPDWVPAQRTDRKGNLKVATSGKPVMETAMISQAEEKDMYHYGRVTSPELSSKIVSHCKTAILDKLKSDTPYDHQGDARYTWQAVLAHECQLSNYNRNGRSFPIPAQDMDIYYKGRHSGKVGSDMAPQIESFAGNAATIKFPIWSRKSGRHNLNVIARIAVGKLSRGHKRILQQLVAGTSKISDSKVVKEDGKWYVHVAHEMEVKDYGLDKGLTATLLMGPDNSFVLELPSSTDRKRVWTIGDDKFLLTQHHRLIGRRKSMEFSSQFGQGRGRGKKRFFAAARRPNLELRHHAVEFQNNVVADVLKACIKNGCGKLVYREPTKPLRELSWFSRQGIEFNWTNLLGKLKHSAKLRTIEVEVTRMRVAEWKEKYPPKSKTA